ncbi:MAG TPA: hypothetical protein VM144_10780 [Aestuariivirga sp.]|nr:hypothetical protein [Aestuariivirga sp.]
MCEPFVVTDEFYTAIGKLTVAWQVVESPLDVLTGILYWRAGGKQHAPKKDELPRSFDVKLKYCRKCFGTLENLSDLREGALIVLTKAKQLSLDRHRLTHGLVDNFTPVKPGVILINRIVYERDKHFLETTQTSMSEIIETFEKINALASAVSLLLGEVREKFGVAREVYS